MFRFFVENKINNSFELPKETIKHLKVVRAEKDNFICVHDKKFYECKLNGDHAEIISELNENHEHNFEVIIAAGIIETKNWEFMIQKAVELGATKIIPVYSKNVSKKIPDINAKLDRWNKITLGAAEQSFRNIHPQVVAPMTFDQVISLNILNKFIAHEKKEAEVLKTYPQDSLFLVGPEGGFTDEEVAKASSKGFEVISLGKRILRAETASMFVLSKVI